MKTAARIISQISMSIIYFLSYGSKKEKTKLTHQFCSSFLFLQLFHFTLFYWDFRQCKKG